jgi:hypothetical protein
MRGISLRRINDDTDTVAMTDEWKITEHTVNVAAQFADRWATAVAAQARRIQHPENTLERIPDTWMQVMTLRQLLRAVEMAKTATPQDDNRSQRIEQAILEFLDTVVVKASDAGKASGFKLARDALEHFDEYYRGTGDVQQPRLKRSDRRPDEALAQGYRFDLEGAADGALRLRIGPLAPAEPLVVIDLVGQAPRAARKLARALGLGDGGWFPL